MTTNHEVNVCAIFSTRAAKPDGVGGAPHLRIVSLKSGATMMET
jgi:hypothetical protein